MAEIAQAQLRKFTDDIWNDAIVPTLVEYIAIPNKSPSFEPEWQKLGHMDKAVDLFVLCYADIEADCELPKIAVSERGSPRRLSARKTDRHSQTGRLRGARRQKFACRREESAVPFADRCRTESGRCSRHSQRLVQARDLHLRQGWRTAFCLRRLIAGRPPVNQIAARSARTAQQDVKQVEDGSRKAKDSLVSVCFCPLAPVSRFLTFSP